MKKITSIIFCLAVLFSCSTSFAAVNAAHRNGVNVTAEGECGRELVWILYDDGEMDIEITYKTEALLSNYRLTENFDEDSFIAEGMCDMYNYDSEEAPWYKYREKIKSVVVGEDVTYLGDYAFYNCVNMETVDIHSELLSEIGYDCFRECTSLESISVPERVRIIGSSAFEGCTNLRNITLPNNLQDIYYYTFCMCKNLKEIEINSGVKEIWGGTFANCSNLETVYIPETVEKIGGRAFFGCNSLKTIYYSGDKAQWENISIASGNSIIDNEKIVFLTEDGISDDKICSVCGSVISNENVFYDEDDNLICQECYDELSESEDERKCSVCGEYFKFEDMLYDEDDDLICQECYDELSEPEDERECSVCGEYFKFEDMMYDEDDNLICRGCYDELQNYDEEINKIECPNCGKVFEETEDVYNEEGYVFCPYCDEYIDDTDKKTEDIEIEFSTSDWAAEEIYEAYQNNLIPDEMLYDSLYKTISREEFAAVAIKLYENVFFAAIPYSDINDTPFIDCNYASEYNGYIAAAYAVGITNGTGEATFSPYENITREQLATMISRISRPANNGCAEIFADHWAISPYAVDAVYRMAAHNIIKGVGDNCFAPQETATKEQAIIISLRTLKTVCEARKQFNM